MPLKEKAYRCQSLAHFRNFDSFFKESREKIAVSLFRPTIDASIEKTLKTFKRPGWNPICVDKIWNIAIFYAFCSNIVREKYSKTFQVTSIYFVKETYCVEWHVNGAEYLLKLISLMMHLHILLHIVHMISNTSCVYSLQTSRKSKLYAKIHRT